MDPSIVGVLEIVENVFRPPYAWDVGQFEDGTVIICAAPSGRAKQIAIVVEDKAI